MSTPMVQAVLDGRKTMTRRVVKPQPAGEWAAPGRSMSPYGKVGDRLWVRETFSEGYTYRYEGDSKIKVRHFKYRADFVGKSLDGIFVNGTPKKPIKDQADLYVWKPSIFMPREACRINLEITGVRVERLKHITEEDVSAEGVTNNYRCRCGGVFGYYEGGGETWDCDCLSWEFSGLVRTFADLWNGLNAKRGFGWDVNPWVWCIEFRKLPEVAR